MMNTENYRAIKDLILKRIEYNNNAMECYSAAFSRIVMKASAEKREIYDLTAGIMVAIHSDDEKTWRELESAIQKDFPEEGQELENWANNSDDEEDRRFILTFNALLYAFRMIDEDTFIDSIENAIDNAS